MELSFDAEVQTATVEYPRCGHHIHEEQEEREEQLHASIGGCSGFLDMLGQIIYVAKECREPYTTTHQHQSQKRCEASG